MKGRGRARAGFVLVSALLLSGALTGVFAEGSRETPESSGAADAAVTVTWAPYAAKPISNDKPVVDWFEQKYNMVVDPIYLENTNYQQLLNLRIASGEIPDIIYLGNNNLMYSYHSQGVLAAMDESFFRRHAPGISAFIDKDDPSAWRLMKIEGKIVGLPQINLVSWRRVPVIRTDWLSNVGIGEVPRTLDEAEAAFYAFRNDDPDQNGRKDTYGLSMDGLETVFGAYGAYPFPVDEFMWHVRSGRLVYSGVVPEMKDALTRLATWYKDGVIDPEFITGENKGGYWALSHDFANGRIGFTTRGRDYHWYKAGEVAGQNIGQNAELVLGIDKEAAFEIVTPFVGPKGMGGGFKPQISYIRYGFGVQLEKDTPKLARILQIIDGITTDDLDAYVTSENGFRGTHWEWAPDGTVKQLAIPDWRDRQADLGAFIRTIVNPDFEYKLQERLAQYRDQKYARWEQEKLGYSNSLAVGLPSQSTYRADLDAFVLESYLKIITGEEPVSYFDRFVAEWNRRGGEQLTREANTWYAGTTR